MIMTQVLMVGLRAPKNSPLLIDDLSGGWCTEHLIAWGPDLRGLAVDLGKWTRISAEIYRPQRMSQEGTP